MGRHRDRPPKQPKEKLETMIDLGKVFHAGPVPNDPSTWTAKYAKEKRDQTNDMERWAELDRAFRALLIYEAREKGSKLKHPFSGAYRPEDEEQLDLLGNAHAVATPT